MKRTDIERRERELRRSQKKEDVLARKTENFKSKNSVGQFIDELALLFFHNDDEIFNCTSEIKIVELVEEMKLTLPEKNWESVLRKAIKKTGVNQKDKALDELKSLL